MSKYSFKSRNSVWIMMVIMISICVVIFNFYSYQTIAAENKELSVAKKESSTATSHVTQDIVQSTNTNVTRTIDPPQSQAVSTNTNMNRTNQKCVSDYHSHCNMHYANEIVSKPHHYNQTISKTIQRFTYLVDNRHGGRVQMDVTSFLHYKLNIPSSNILSFCHGSYCEHMDKLADKYWNINDSTKISQLQHKLAKKNPGFGHRQCCWTASTRILRRLNLTRSSLRFTEALNASLPSLHGTFDVIICGFPGIQCLGYLGVAKVLIIRFAHRYDHHVWNNFGAREKWTKILNMIAEQCSNNNYNILIFVSNIYDWFYVKHSINIDAKRLYLWPNFAQHFVTEFGVKEDTQTRNRSDSLYIYQDTKTNRDCVNTVFDINIVQETLARSSIHLEINQSRSKRYLFDKLKLHSMVNGIIVMPYAVHSAKWSEFYSVGIQLFFPSLSLWIRLNNRCSVICDRQYGNAPTRRMKWNTHLDYQYSPCCGTNPYTNEYMDMWLSFSDYYWFKHVIYYDNATDLIDKIKRHHHDNKSTKKKQMDEWDALANHFKDKIAYQIWKAYQASLEHETNCIPDIIESAQYIINISNLPNMGPIYV
eukprot:1084882_1